MIDVINRGSAGRRRLEEFSRIESCHDRKRPSGDLAGRPTNAVYKSYSPAEVRATLEAGLDVLAAFRLTSGDGFPYTRPIVGPPDRLSLANTIIAMNR